MRCLSLRIVRGNFLDGGGQQIRRALQRVFQRADATATHADMLKLVWDALKAHAWVSFRDVCGTIGFDPRDNADFGNAREVSIVLITLVRRGYAVARGTRGSCVYATAENAARAAERTKN